MKWEQNQCPVCLLKPEEILEAVECMAKLEPNGNDGYKYTNETRMLWDTFMPKREASKETLRCDNDHFWETVRIEGEEEN